MNHFEYLSTNPFNFKSFQKITREPGLWAERPLILLYDDSDERERLWRNPPEHLCGDHDNCVHPNQFPVQRGRPQKNEEEGKQKQFKVWKRGAESPQTKGGLYKYCDKTVNFVRNAAPENDSYNDQLIVYAPKSI